MCNLCGCNPCIDCASGEVQIEYVGKQGPPGPAGPAGPQGIQGPAGSDNMTTQYGSFTDAEFGFPGGVAITNKTSAGHWVKSGHLYTWNVTLRFQFNFGALSEFYLRLPSLPYPAVATASPLLGVGNYHVNVDWFASNNDGTPSPTNGTSKYMGYMMFGPTRVVFIDQLAVASESSGLHAPAFTDGVRYTLFASGWYPVSVP